MENPYASPCDQTGRASAPGAAGDSSSLDVHRLRAERRGAEVALRQYSLALTGVYVLLGAASSLPLFGPWSGKGMVAGAILTTVMTTAALLSIVVNWGVRRFASWTRVPLIVLCALALPLYPIGTALAREILTLVRSGPPPRLLSREYEFVVRQTAQFKQRTSALTWIGLFGIILIVVLYFIIAQLPPEMRQLKR